MPRFVIQITREESCSLVLEAPDKEAAQAWIDDADVDELWEEHISPEPAEKQIEITRQDENDEPDYSTARSDPYLGLAYGEEEEEA